MEDRAMRIPFVGLFALLLSVGAAAAEECRHDPRVVTNYNHLLAEVGANVHISGELPIFDHVGRAICLTGTDVTTGDDGSWAWLTAEYADNGNVIGHVIGCGINPNARKDYYRAAPAEAKKWGAAKISDMLTRLRVDIVGEAQISPTKRWPEPGGRGIPAALTKVKYVHPTPYRDGGVAYELNITFFSFDPELDQGAAICSTGTLMTRLGYKGTLGYAERILALLKRGARPNPDGVALSTGPAVGVEEVDVGVFTTGGNALVVEDPPARRDPTLP